MTEHVISEQEQKLVDRIEANPKYAELCEKRQGFAVKLSLFVLAIFYAFILTIAFNPAVLGTKTGTDTVMTVAFPIAALIIVVSFITTLIYVSRANGEFEDLTDDLKEDVKDLV